MRSRGWVLALLVAGVAAQAAPDEKAKAVSARLDELFRSRTSHGRMRMQVQAPDFQRELSLDFWSRGADDALVRILAPKKESGTASLKKGAQMWNYLPKIGKTVRIPPSMLMSSWMGSDFTHDDLVQAVKYSVDYEGTTLPSAPEGQTCVELKARPDAAVAWERVVACVDARTLVPVTCEYHDDKGRLARRLTFSDVRKVGERLTPHKLVVTPLTKQGHQTTLLYDTLEFDTPASESLFTLSALTSGGG